MNPAPKPRFTCRAVRLWREINGSPDAAAARSRHVNRCPDCQAYYQASASLAQELSRQAPRPAQPLSDDLARRISLAVRQAPTASRRRERPRVHYASLMGATIAAVAAIFVVRTHHPATPSDSHAATPALSAPIDVNDLVANVDTMGIKFMNTVEPSAARIASDNPLAREMSNVRADARSAISYLALNFLPSDTLQRLPSAPDNS